MMKPYACGLLAHTFQACIVISYRWNFSSKVWSCRLSFNQSPLGFCYLSTIWSRSGKYQM